MGTRTAGGQVAAYRPPALRYAARTGVTALAMLALAAGFVLAWLGSDTRVLLRAGFVVALLSLPAAVVSLLLAAAARDVRPAARAWAMVPALLALLVAPGTAGFLGEVGGSRTATPPALDGAPRR